MDPPSVLLQSLSPEEAKIVPGFRGSAAAKVTVPTTLILGERDMMTPAKAGKALAAAIANARTIMLPGAGHMTMVERPDELLAALQA